VTANIEIIKTFEMYMDKIQKTFDEWAKIGRDDLMEKEHANSVVKCINSIQFKKNFSFLDIGCGNGWVVRMVAAKKNSRQVIGIDKSAGMIKKAKELASTSNQIFIKTDLNAWRAQKKFDYIFSMESLYYVDSLEKALKKIHGLLNEDGVFYCGTDFYKDNKATAIWKEKMNLKMHLLSIKEWIKAFEDAGFIVRTRQIKDKKSNKKWKREHGTLFIIGKKS
jgi:SAM-dependent methyltransferase